MFRRYFGITDFTDFSQVEKMYSVFQAHKGSDSESILHVGVMMSYKTFHGLPTKWADVFPPIEWIPGIFQSDKVYNCLHYADYDDSESDHGLRMYVGLYKMATSMAQCGWNALQLDIPWPNPVLLEDIRLHMPQEVILQVGAKALEIVGNDPREVVNRLEQYLDRGVIDRILLDKSMGKGLGMNAKELLLYIRAIKDKWPDIEDAQIVVAGGLGPFTMHLVEPILEEFPGVSIDAQGRLRPSGSALDPIDWSLAKAYLVRALELFEPSLPPAA